MPKNNQRTGSSFTDFLKETGDYEIVTARAMKRLLAEQLEEEMAARSIKKSEMAGMMKTSRSQVDRVLDPDNLSLQLDTLIVSGQTSTS